MITLTERTFPQPTLSLYLGGTGVMVGDRLLAIAESLDAKDRALIEPFFIDSQQPAIVDHARSRHYCYQNINQFHDPTFKDFRDKRFPANLGITPVVNSCEGCGVTRIFGAASLVACRDNFMSLLGQAAGRLHRNRRESTQPLQVFLTASACGGTGAGMILDAAALVRHFFRERGETPRIFLFLIGPTVFMEDPNISLREDQRARMRASSYALLKELNHFAQGHEFVSEYRLRDQTIRIGNRSDDDRLFEWVYLIDGRGEQTGATRTLDQVTWMMAEAQVHLAVTEVGRKVAESMPNQREERLREYALHFVHNDHKGRLSDSGRERLLVASRRTFLSSFSIRNVRFPVEEIRTWLRISWVQESLQKIMRRGSDRGRSLIEQYDNLLGYDGENVQQEGLLSSLGLTREELSAHMQQTSIEDQALLKALGVGLTPDNVGGAVEELLAAAGAVLEDLKKDASLADSPRENADTASAARLVQRALPRWRSFWVDGLSRNGRISERLWQIACAPAGGRGLAFLDGFIAHAADVLMLLAEEGRRRPSVEELEENVEDLRRDLLGFRRAVERSRSKRFTWRSVLVLTGRADKYTDELLRRTKSLITKSNALRKRVLEQRSLRVADLLAPIAWQEAAQQLKGWRDNVLAPTITATHNALTLADNRRLLARDALSRHQGVNRRGPWQALSTVQVADDELLETLVMNVGGRVSVEDIVLLPLQAEGLSRDRRRLTIRALSTFDQGAIVDMLNAHVRQATESVLAFLDSGWMLPEVGESLRTSASHVLDVGAEPLVSFSRAAIGQPLQSYLLAPRDVLLPDPFGQELGRMNRLTSRDPLQLGVVSFVFGIPPNSLEGMRDVFHQYAVHVGDSTRYEGFADRYPLHVFRDAAESFDEPYSPIGFDTSDDFVASLIDVAGSLWPDEHGGIRLDIRDFDIGSVEHRNDRNRIIELAEKVLHELILAPAEARRIFSGGCFPELERLYRMRRHESQGVPPHKAAGRSHEETGGNGNGDAPGYEPAVDGGDFDTREGRS